ncbi:single-stranded DNA-binding protein [Blautia sp. NSJ-34]|uniref:Single-stranded DNA-binding protein n=1 Tax=Blautia celeris TaxID=2763026 RepID=A0ABR7FK64_9FIRM|nr:MULTISPECIES: single-stranded DNA-binding protein [Blautia]MBC5675605.1 single-stranded DNA-binding protein [Blautia celeris]
MNKVCLMGRLTREPDTRYSQGENSMMITRYTLAVDRIRKREGEATADFIRCVEFGKQAEFAGKYFRQGTKIAVSGRIQTGSYVNRDGNKVYTTDVVVYDQEFAESKKASEQNRGQQEPPVSEMPVDAEGFMTIPEGIDEELPFT